MRLFMFSLALSVVLPGLKVHGNEAYYFLGSDSIPLQVDSSKALVKFVDGTLESHQNNLFVSLNRVVGTLPHVQLRYGFKLCTLLVTPGYFSFLDSLKNNPTVELVEPYFTDVNDNPRIVNSRIHIGFDPSLSTATEDGILGGWHAVRVKEIPELEGVYQIRNTKLSGMQLIELANAL